MVDNIKGEFTFGELGIIRNLIGDKISYGCNVNDMKSLIRLYDKVDGYLDKILEETDKKE